MKIIHTSDWHIGKKLNEKSMLEEQIYFLEQLREYIQKENVDVLLISGDIYDKKNPSISDIEVVDRYLSGIVLEDKCSVIAISGNHDSAERLSYGAEIFNKLNLHFITHTNEYCNKITYGNVDFYPLPFCELSNLKRLYGLDFKDLNEAFKHQIEKIKENMNPETINILLAHEYIADVPQEKGIYETQQPIYMGGAEYIDASILEPFSYVALGHIHRAHSVYNDKIRYSGSPVKYSVQESGIEKSVYLLELDDSKISNIKALPIKSIRNIVKIKGLLRDLLEKSSDDYVFFELLDHFVEEDTMRKLLVKYPNAISARYIMLDDEFSFTDLERDMVYKNDMKELFAYFYNKITGEKLSDKSMERIESVIRGTEDETDIS